jgi:hypothetical protein
LRRVDERTDPLWTAKYPYTPEAKRYISLYAPDLQEFQKDDLRHLLDYAVERVLETLQGEYSGIDEAEAEAVTYPIAFALVKLTGNHAIHKAFARGESRRAFRLLMEENPRRVVQVASSSFDMDIEYSENQGSYVIGLLDYVRVSANLLSKAWWLANRRVESGRVYMNFELTCRFVAEQVRRYTLRRLGEVTSKLPEFLESFSTKIEEEYQRMVETGVIRKRKRRAARYGWIEEVMKTPVADGRHRLLWLIIAPYLVNVKGLDLDEAREKALTFMRECDKVKKMEGNLEGLVNYYVDYAARKRLKPLSKTTLEEKYPHLYSIIME